LQDSPELSKSEVKAIDENLLLVAHQGRKPGLDLHRGEEKISLQDWASELCNRMKGVAGLLDRANHCENYFSSVKSQIASIFDPELTPSARMIAEMKDNDIGFFHHAQSMSKRHYKYYKNQPLSEEKIHSFEEMTKRSLQEQKKAEEQDSVSFDEFLENYFNEA
jgi:glutamate--cysteine ligase